MVRTSGHAVVLRALVNTSPLSQANAEKEDHAEQHGDAGEGTMRAEHGGNITRGRRFLDVLSGSRLIVLMMTRPLRLLRLLLSVLLLLGISRVGLMRAAMAECDHMPAGHHHGGHQTPPQPGSPDGCCDMCAAASTLPNPYVRPIGVASVAVRIEFRAAGTSTGLASPPPVWHRLPFSQGPPLLPT
jgi:hypothetical protein